MISTLTTFAYPLTFLEGVISFISPCLLPLLPIYVAFFAGEHVEGSESDEGDAGLPRRVSDAPRNDTVGDDGNTTDGLPRRVSDAPRNDKVGDVACADGSGAHRAGGRRMLGRSVGGAVAFMIGFTLIFTAMGAFAGSIGRVLIGHRRLLEIICGGAIIVFGLSYLGLFQLPSLVRSRRLDGSGSARQADGGAKTHRSPARFAWLLRPFAFGLSFSLTWTPCVGAFLGSALMLAASRTSWAEGAALLLCYSLGLGLPFVLSALLIDRLKTSIAVIMRHHRLITRVSGALLIAVGLLLVFGLFGIWVARLSSVSW